MPSAPTSDIAASRPSRDPLAAWETAPSSGDQFACLDGVRGVAILMVVACHAFYANPTGPVFPKLIVSLTGSGTMGVEVFFALSGFVISYPFFLRKARGQTPCTPPGYFGRRFWRIYPPLLLSTVCFLVFYHFTLGDMMLREAIWWLVGWPHLVPVEMHFNPVVWSLVIEVQFYVTLPLLFIVTRSLDYRRTAWGMIAFLLIVPFLARQLPWPAHPSQVQAHYFFRRYPGFLNCFAWGMMVSSAFAWARVKGGIPAQVGWSRLAKWGWVGLGATIFVTGVLNYVMPEQIDLNRWWLEAACTLPAMSTFLLLQYIWAPSLIGSRLLASTPLRWLGLVSYEWYLFHQPFIYWFRDWVGSAGGNLFQYCWHIGVPALTTLAVAALVYRFFSLPILRAHRGMSRHARTPSPAAVPHG